MSLIFSSVSLFIVSLISTLIFTISFLEINLLFSFWFLKTEIYTIDFWPFFECEHSELQISLQALLYLYFTNFSALYFHFSLSFSFKYLLIFFGISSLIYRWFRNLLLNFQIFEDFQKRVLFWLLKLHCCVQRTYFELFQFFSIYFMAQLMIDLIEENRLADI